MIINLQPTHLENSLVKISPLMEHDFERFFNIASDPLIWAQHPAKDRYKPEVFKSFFDSAVDSGTAFLIFDKSDSAVIGTTRFYEFKPEESSIAIGYTFLKRDYWGGMFNFAMKKLLLDYAFGFVDSVRFHIGAVNIRSQKAVLKLGAEKKIEMEMGDSKQLYFEYELKKENWLGRNL